MVLNAHHEEFLLHFESYKSEIDSLALGESILSLTTAVAEINKALNTGKRISINIKPFEPGSFNVPFELIEAVIAGTIFSSQSLSCISDILKILKEFVEIKIKLKGLLPKSVEEEGSKAKITTQNGDVYNIGQVTGDLVVNNIAINNAFNNSMKRLINDGSINEYRISRADKNPIVIVRDEEFEYFTEPRILEIKKEQQKTIETKLHIHKVVFDDTSKWGFILEGHKISAKILDEDFQKRIQTEERFGNGDKLVVRMRIYQVFDETANTYVNKEFEILEVIEHMPKPKQLEIQ